MGGRGRGGVGVGFIVHTHTHTHTHAHTHTHTHTHTHRLKLEKGKSIPLEDRQLALALILELALQRGGLQHLLDAVLLLLAMSGMPGKANTMLKSEVCVCMCLSLVSGLKPCCYGDRVQVLLCRTVDMGQDLGKDNAN